MALPRVNETDTERLFEDSTAASIVSAETLQKILDINVRMFEQQDRLLDTITLLLDERRETTVPETAPSNDNTPINDKLFPEIQDLGLGFLDAFLLAIAAWSFGVDDYIKTVVLPKTIGYISDFTKSIGSVFTTLKTNIVSFFAPISDDLKKPFVEIQKMISRMISPILETVGKPFTAMSNFFTAVVEAFNKRALPGIPALTKSAIDALGPFRETVQSFAKFIFNLTSEIKKLYTETIVGDFVKAFRELFTSAKDFLSNQLSFVGDLFKSPIEQLKTIGASFATAARSLVGAFTAVQEGTTVFGRIIQSVGGFFQAVGSKMAPLLKFLKFAGGPFVLAMFAIFDFVKGFMDGFKDGGILGGLKEGTLELIRSFIFVPLDLLKDLVSWASEKLGFENFSDTLDSFSFVDIFNQLVESIVGGVKSLADWVGTMFSDPTKGLDQAKDYLTELLGDLSSFGEKFLKALLQFALPDPNSFTGSLIAKAAPQLYEFANVETAGAVVAPSGLTQSSIEMVNRTTEVSTAQSRPVSSPVVVAPSNVGNSSTVLTNNVSVASNPPRARVADLMYGIP